MINVFNVAIDGPSGAGKSTIAKIIAKDYGIMYLDTGAMYRGIGYYLDGKGIDVNDIDSVKKVIDDISVNVVYQDGVQKIIVDDNDVTPYIREHRVSKLASDVSKIPEVRLKLVEEQRKIASNNSIVLDGRDITSYVLPNAKYKFYLDASPEIRAERRYKELIEKGQTEFNYDSILKDIIDRDYNDSHRAFAPLVRVPEAIYIDTSNMTLSEVLSQIKGHVKE